MQVEPAPEVEPALEVDDIPAPEPETETAPAGDEDAPPEPRPGLSALFDSRRATVVLVVLAAVLALVAGGLSAWDRWLRDDEPAATERPVQVGADDATAAVDAAAEAAETIFTRTADGYDDQIEAATELMTEDFAAEFRETAADVEDDFVEARTDQQVRVVAQGVARATRSEVQALLFMNYYVTKGDADTTYTPYRALVTVVHTETGWLVSDIDTK